MNNNKKEYSIKEIQKFRNELITKNHEDIILLEGKILTSEIYLIISVLVTLFIQTSKSNMQDINQFSKLTLNILQGITVTTSVYSLSKIIKLLLKITRLEHMNEMLKYQNVIDTIEDESKKLTK